MSPTGRPTRARRWHSQPLPHPASRPPETARPRSTPEKRCSALPADAVSSGHIAQFDVWGNPEELELTNSSCPPYVEHISAGDVRSPSSNNIEETVIHIPSTTKVTLNETDCPKAVYGAVWTADDEQNPDSDGHGIVWALPACPPAAAANDLCLMFSAAPLNDVDWVGNIEYHIDHAHQTDIDKQDLRYTLAYDAYDASATGPFEAIWDSSDARIAVMPVPQPARKS